MNILQNIIKYLDKKAMVVLTGVCKYFYAIGVPEMERLVFQQRSNFIATLNLEIERMIDGIGMIRLRFENLSDYILATETTKTCVFNYSIDNCKSYRYLRFYGKRPYVADNREIESRIAIDFNENGTVEIIFRYVGKIYNKIDSKNIKIVFDLQKNRIIIWDAKTNDVIKIGRKHVILEDVIGLDRFCCDGNENFFLSNPNEHTDIE